MGRGDITEIDDEPTEKNRTFDSMGSINDINSPNYSDKHLRRNRRRMAWAAMASMQLVMLIVLFKIPESKLQIIGEIIIWYFFSMSAVIGGYIGFSTVFDLKQKK